MPYFIGIDFGTSSIKTGIFSETGRQAGFIRKEFAVDDRRPGFLEFDIDEYMETAFQSVKKTIDKSKIEPANIQAIACVSQAQSFVFTDTNHHPLHPAISWLDSRARREAAELREKFSSQAYSINDICSAAKILWFKKNMRGIIENTAHIFLIQDYFIFLLTGNAFTDPRSAESTGFYSSASGIWHERMLAECGVSRKMFATVAEPGTKAGRIKREPAKRAGLAQDTEVAVGANDNLGGAIAVANVKPGIASLSMGTALSLLTSMNVKPHVNRACLRPHPVKGLYAVLYFTKSAGGLLDRLKNEICRGLDFDHIFEEINKIEIGSDGLCFVPAPEDATRQNGTLPGGMFGLTTEHTRFHIARAMIESLIFSVCENVEKLKDLNPVKTIRAIGGGSRSRVWLQMIADATGIEIEIPGIPESASFGAAQCAMAACDDKNDLKQISGSLYSCRKKITPDRTKYQAYRRAGEKHRAIKNTMYA